MFEGKDPMLGAGLPQPLIDRAERSRREFVFGLKATGDFAEQIRLWRAGNLYRATGKPEVILNLKSNPDGSVMGWVQDSGGRFVGQARWSTATTWGSRVISSASVLAGYAMLVEISYKLDRIESKVDRMSQALDDGRRQALKAAVDSVSVALACEPDTGRDLLIAAATPLRTVIRQEIQELSRSIERTPMPPRSHAEGFVWDKGRDTRRELATAEVSFLAALQGIRALTYLYIGLGQDRAAWTSAHDLLLQLSEAGLSDAWYKARNLRPDKPEDQPEAFWTRAMDVVAEARTQAITYRQDAPSSLTLSLSDAELELVLENP